MRIRLAVLSALLATAGCGFRSGIDDSRFALESFALDQTSYVQGEPGTATVTLRNVGPRPAALPELGGLSTSFVGEAVDFTTALVSATEDDIPPQGTGTYVFSFESTQAAEPRTVNVKVKDAAGRALGEQSFELLRAATVKAISLAYEFGPGFGAAPPAYTCRGVDRPAFLTATVENIGTTYANLSNIALQVGDGNDSFESHLVGETNPTSIGPGATATFHLQIGALASADPGDDYTVTWTATVTDALTGDDRGEPTYGHAPVFLQVHMPASFELEVVEGTDSISTGAPNAGLVKILVQNVGTVPGRIDSASLSMFIADSTAAEYSIPTPGATFPLTVGPNLDVADIPWADVTLTSATPTLGTTSVGGSIDVTDTTCERTFTQLVPEADRGSWVVE